MTNFWAKLCTVSLSERQFATLHLFHAYTECTARCGQLSQTDHAGSTILSARRAHKRHHSGSLHGVGADGVGVKFPIFAVNCCCLPLSFRRKRGKMRRKRGEMRKKGEKCVKKGEKCVKKGKITPTPSTPTPLRTSRTIGFGITTLFIRETQRGSTGGVELLKELHRLLKNPPPLKKPPPLLKKRPTSYSPYETPLLKNPPPLLKNPPPLLQSIDPPSWLAQGFSKFKSWFSGRGWGQQLFTFQSPAVHWMARTSSLNCLSCRNPYQTPHSLNCLPPFHWKPLFFTEKCFVASPPPKSALIIWRGKNLGHSDLEAYTNPS